MKQATCPKCGRVTWHKTHAAVIDRKPRYEDIVNAEGKVEKIRIEDEVRVLKPSEIRKHTCKRHSPKTATNARTRDWRTGGPRHKNRKAKRTHA